MNVFVIFLIAASFVSSIAKLEMVVQHVDIVYCSETDYGTTQHPPSPRPTLGLDKVLKTKRRPAAKRSIRKRELQTVDFPNCIDVEAPTNRTGAVLQS